MAAYWRSPYRELSNSFRAPNHSTLKFEQSLYLTRAKTAINSSRYEWFDDAFHPSPNRSFKQHNEFTRSNTVIKSILKTPRRDNKNISNNNNLLFPGKEDSNNNTFVKESSTLSSPDVSTKNQKKRVTFGENIDLDNDGNDATSRNSIHLLNRKCQSMAMKRISHSRMLEESALKKLNKLIGGVVQESILPTVTGKGLVSPRPNNNNNNNNNNLDKPSKHLLCKHEQDLKCIRCIQKDVENDDNNNNNTISGKLNVKDKFVTRSNGHNFSENNNNNNNNNKNNNNNSIKEVDVSSINLSNILDISNRHVKSRLSHDNNIITRTENDVKTSVSDFPLINREETEHHNVNWQTSPPLDIKKKHHRLLPGRYPFNTGAITIKKLFNNDELVDKPETIVTAVNGSDVVELQNVLVDTLRHKGGSSTNQHNEVTQRRINRSASFTSRADTTTTVRIPTIVQASTTEIEPRADESMSNTVNVSNDSESGNANSRTRKSTAKDKTSEILHWLDDVHQKQTFTPRLSRNYVLQEQQQPS